MRRLALLTTTVLLASFSAAAQLTVYDGQALRKGEYTFSVAYQRGSVKEEKLASKLMGRELPYRIILPARYSTENSSERFPVVYLLHGLTGHFDNWTDKTRIELIGIAKCGLSGELNTNESVAPPVITAQFVVASRRFRQMFERWTSPR